MPVEGTIAFVDALRAAGGDVELHLFEGEGHGFRQPANQLAEYRLITSFLSRHFPPCRRLERSGTVPIWRVHFRQSRRTRPDAPARTRCARPASAVASRAVSEWDPNDPETVKVHYDVSSWSIDQRAELTEALADAEIAHRWEDDELVVPEELEAVTDELFERLEELLGPFAVPLGDDDPGVEYGLDEWPPADRQTLTQALVESEVPHRWDGTTLLVATDAEAAVDALLDAVEQGTIVLTGGPAGTGAPEGALSTLFTASDRLARDADDHTGRDDLRELLPQLDRTQPPYGVAVGTWAKSVEAAGALGCPARR